MKENIHIKISSKDKQILSKKAEELGLSLSGFIRFKLKESIVVKEVILREVAS
jgi:hypothetical protein